MRNNPNWNKPLNLIAHITFPDKSASQMALSSFFFDWLAVYRCPETTVTIWFDEPQLKGKRYAAKI